ncbi:uncharacterized protein [Taeniopygia guttata]|uniref:uncharacterized protein n=1 Tax=Taeniopygia guttata TaxID=59729 RepID=UPI003BB94D03
MGTNLSLEQKSTLTQLSNNLNDVSFSNKLLLRFVCWLKAEIPNFTVRELNSLAFWNQIGQILTLKVENGEHKVSRFIPTFLQARKKILEAEKSTQTQTHSSNTPFSPSCPPPKYPSPENPSPTPYSPLKPCFSKKYTLEFVSESTAVSQEHTRPDHGGGHVLRPAPAAPPTTPLPTRIPLLPRPSATPSAPTPSSLPSSDACLSPIATPHPPYQCQPPCCPGNRGGAGPCTAPRPSADDSGAGAGDGSPAAPSRAGAGHGSPAAQSRGGARVSTVEQTAREGGGELPLTGVGEGAGGTQACLYRGIYTICSSSGLFREKKWYKNIPTSPIQGQNRNL